jgi:hypothetical protein
MIPSIALPTGFRKKQHWDNVDWYDVRSPHYSNFDFVDHHFQSKNTILRVFSLVRKLGFRSFAIEELKGNGCVLKNEEDELLRKCNTGFKNSEVYRISFFSSNLDSVPIQDNFLGYVVTKQDFYEYEQPNTYIYEAILPPYRKEKDNNFLHCKRTYQVEYEFGTFNVTGALYAQQNGKTNVCAHVALRTVLSLLLPEGDISYARINQIAGICKYPVDHLTPSHINKVLESHKVFSRMESKKSLEMQKIPSHSSLLYGNIESRCPSLWAFNVDESQDDVSHIVPVLGHTFNEDSWVACADRKYFGGKEHYSSESWLSTYLIHDDNFGPYFCVPKNYLEKQNFSCLVGLHWNNEHALYSDVVEKTALDYVKTILNDIKQHPCRPNSSWYRRLESFVDTNKEKVNTFILRPTFIRKTEYITFLTSYRMEQHLIEQFEKLPDEFWLVEISCPELFSATRAKIGDILLTIENDITLNTSSAKPLAYRLPNIVYFENDCNTPPQKTKKISGYLPLWSN